ncbi:MAG: hypothetical protein KKE17_06605 [Proteobacteria bacterium]|nr:hypothetical protein [Pseudomonadota bacterium]MBU1709658.1 hypothetical protein [Pseudomonadota bacterium]
MKCSNPENCKAYQNSGTPCWEIVETLDDYRSTFAVCKDCIVYLMKQQNCRLPDQEIQTILANRGVCILAG